MKNKIVIISVSIVSAIILIAIIFCSVWFTVSVDVNSKLNKITEEASEFTTYKSGNKYTISSQALVNIFSEELKDVNYTNSLGIIEAINYLRSSIYLWYGDKNYEFIKIDGDKVYIGVMCYRANRDIESNIGNKIFAAARINS